MTEDFCKVTDDEEESCQSNCEQPGSGGSNGNIRNRVIGYYEAWVHDRKCNGMSIEQIPVGALTHLMFSFAYVTPMEFQITPMDDLDPSLFSKMTAMKRKNKALKVMVALGGWTFNDPGPTQTVFHDLASSKANRAKFIGNLLSFMRQYAFDGVDFDWEYPGAEDRGGSEEDGENFTLLLEELRDAINNQPIEYVVSFTTPTSFWYLRHFDIKGSTDAVDFVNIMSYDLHGVWDAWNPIGSNCTKNSGTLAYREIVDVIEQHKLKPYYDEEHQVKYIVWNQNQWISYDNECIDLCANASPQDDEETIAAKIEFANSQGLGGLIIWSVDQDTDDLSALAAVVGPQTFALALKSTVGEDAAYWQDMGAQDCYVTGCGGECKTGFKEITHQPCGDATFLFRHSTEEDSKLCCPLSRSDAPECVGRCEPGEVGLQLNKWGDSTYCENGHKMYCCDTATTRENKCYFADDGQKCKSDEQPITWSGRITKDYDKLERLYELSGSDLSEALEEYDLSDVSLYCCPPEDFERWDDCEWKGAPDQGNCFDGHCDLNTQVAVTWAGSGGGRVCGGIDPGRLRVFCCAPPSGEPLFLPVPLKDLFPDPPTGDDVKTKFDLNIDNTWGDGEADNDSEDNPNEAAFQFHVLASPGEIQVSLDKRDGSHWEVFNCNDAVSEGEHTVQMVCTDSSERSNCGDVYKGHGVEGTILEMPQNQGCGPGKYAVAKSLEPAGNQTLPRHLVKRNSLHATIYDLKFDYNFTRVPRDFGPTQLRVDFSNQEGYWNKIVAAPSSKKSKRTLDDVGGNHRRWLEEEWRDDYHRGSVSREELHRRWFGDDALQWLKELLHIDVKVEKRHDYEEEVSAIILKEDWTCGPFRAKIDAVATAAIEMSTSFGITIITELGPNMDLSRSYIHFNNEGSIEAILTIDALMKMEWDSGVFTIVPLPIPGGNFKITGIVQLGPRFDLNARFKAGVSIEGRIEAKAELANWEIRQTYPQQDDYKPKEVDSANRQFPTDGIASPSFDVSVTAQGYAEAHIIPTLAFGIKFDKQWDLEDAEIELYGDLYGRVRAKSDLVGGDCLFGYKVEAGVKLVADAHVPDFFKWNPSPHTFGELNKRIIPEGDEEWECVTADTKRHIEGRRESRNSSLASHSLIGKSSLRKRLVPYEPLIKLPNAEKLCPVKGNQGAQDCADTQNIFDFYDDSTSDAQPVEFRKRDVIDDDDLYAKGPFVETNEFNDYGDDEKYEPSANETHLVDRGLLTKRAPGKKLSICDGAHKFHIKKWDTSGAFDIYDNADWSDCNNYDFGIQATRQQVPYTTRAGNPAFEEYAVEHVLEGQMVLLFFETTAFSDLCFDMGETGSGWFDTNVVDPIAARAPRRSPWQYIADAWPYSRGTETRARIPYPAHKEDEFVFVIGPVNNIKSKAFQNFPSLSGTDDMEPAVASEATVGNAIRTMKTALMLWKYLTTTVIRDTLVAQATRVGDRMEEMEDLLRNDPNYTSQIQGMKALWMSFMKGRTDLAASKVRAFIRQWMPRIEQVLDNTNAAQDTPPRAALRVKIQTLKREVDSMASWSNPF
ncbi:hypothetical protein ColTof3_03581 [Colletotrichum tofieldiae]|nr:hypothetical protein ColTof3_03581 [Colletotrichum tofieldiae]